MQQCDAFQSWLCERSAVEVQLNELFAAGLPTSREERQARKIRFLALLERRDAAARDLLQVIPRRESILTSPTTTSLQNSSSTPASDLDS
jgi:hypothetical protein